MQYTCASNLSVGNNVSEGRKMYCFVFLSSCPCFIGAMTDLLLLLHVIPAWRILVVWSRVMCHMPFHLTFQYFFQVLRNIIITPLDNREREIGRKRWTRWSWMWCAQRFHYFFLLWSANSLITKHDNQCVPVRWLDDVSLKENAEANDRWYAMPLC